MRPLIVTLLVVALVGAIDSSSDPAEPARDEFVSYRYGYSTALPAGWQRSTTRLVPKLILPREILSLGTFAMPIGGGGNCGREPVAAIARMGPGDVLVSIQEYEVTSRTRSRLTQTLPRLRSYSSPDRLELRRHPRVPGARGPASPRLWSVTLPFREHGRAFDALVYLAGRPSAELREQIVSILRDLQVGAGDYVGHSDAGRGSDDAVAPVKPLTVTYGPYLGVRCGAANMVGCDTVGIDVVFKQRVTQAWATIAGRRISLTTPGLNTGVRGKDWVGNLHRAGLTRKGSPLYIHAHGGHWAGSPPVHVPIRVTATDADGRRLSKTLPRVPLRPGWG